MRILDIAIKDLVQILRERRTLLFIVAMPIIFTLFMGFAYKTPQADPNADTRMSLAWVNHDDGPLSRSLRERLEEPGSAIKLVEMDEPSALKAVRDGKVHAALILPQGFSTASLQGGMSRLQLVADPATSEGQSIYRLVLIPVTQLMSSVQIARMDVEAVSAQNTAAQESSAAFNFAWQAWGSTNNERLVSLEMAVAHEQAQWYGDNPHNQSSPGILVMFAIFGLVTSATILVQERKSRALERMLTTSLNPLSVLGGHFLAMFALTMLQQVLLVAFGQYALGVNYLRASLGTLALMTALSLCTAGLGLLIGVISKGEEQVTLFSLIGMFVFSALGGVWFPLEMAGQTFSTIGHLTPTAWAMTGFQNILIRGLGSASALLPVGILCLYALGFFGLAMWRFGKTYAA
jgi:ABC-2 type transport system permease protein